MGDVIEFLARVGRDASLRRARGGEYDQALDGAGFDPSTTQALRTRDGDTLRMLMGYHAYFDTQMADPPPPDDAWVPPSREDPEDESGHDDPAPSESLQ